MNYIVDAETIESTMCDKDINCLFGDRTQLCKVLGKIGGRHYVACQHNDTCQYQNKQIGFIECDCPVRQNIYKNHGI